MLLQCMQEQRLDALVSPMSTVPPRKLTSPREPAVNGRSPIGWSLIGQQGFPAITVPAGFTTRSGIALPSGTGGTRLVGPVPRGPSGRRRFHRASVRRADAVQNRLGLRSRDEAPPATGRFRSAAGARSESEPFDTEGLRAQDSGLRTALGLRQHWALGPGP